MKRSGSTYVPEYNNSCILLYRPPRLGQARGGLGLKVIDIAGFQKPAMSIFTTMATLAGHPYPNPTHHLLRIDNNLLPRSWQHYQYTMKMRGY